MNVCECIHWIPHTQKVFCAGIRRSFSCLKNRLLFFLHYFLQRSWKRWLLRMPKQTSCYHHPSVVFSPLSFFFGRFVVIVQSAGNQEGDEKSQKRLFQDLRDAGNSSNIRRILRASPFLASLGWKCCRNLLLLCTVCVSPRVCVCL